MRLLLVELSRFRSRRAIALMMVGAIAVTALIAVITIWDTRPVSAQERAEAETLAATEAAQPHVQREVARCERNPQRYGRGMEAAHCAAMILPRPEWYLGRAELSLADANRDSGLAVLVILSTVMAIVGTTFAGADWASGSMSNQLLFEPRRHRVWLAKAGAVFVGALAVTAVVVAAFWFALYVVAESRGIATGASVQEAIRGRAGRGILLAGVAAFGGYALTMLVRHTVGTVAAMFAYAVGGEILFSSLPIEGIARWSLANNVFAWLTERHEYFDPHLPCPPSRDFCNQLAVLTLEDAVAYLGALLLLLTAVSLWLCRRRDNP
jgi:ABC-2 type transport system permease protein